MYDVKMSQVVLFMTVVKGIQLRLVRGYQTIKPYSRLLRHKYNHNLTKQIERTTLDNLTK